MTREYSEAAVEVLDILKHTAKEKVNLVPAKFINYLKENSAKDYMAHIDYSKPINEMNIKPQTKGLLGVICRNWWWSTDQKQEYDRLLKEKELRHQKELREKYNPDDVFKNRPKKTTTVTESIQQNWTIQKEQIEHQEFQTQQVQQTISTQQDTSMTTYKESFFIKLINKIKKILHI